MPTVLVLTRRPDAWRQLLEAEALPDLAVVSTDDVAEGLRRAGDATVVLGDPHRVRRALPHLPRLAWVQLTWAGAEPLLDPALRRDYALTNVRGVFGPLMAEYVFGALLTHQQQVLPRLEAQRAGRWDEALPGRLRGRTLGLLGVGSIGAQLAATGKHFGMTVHGFTRASEDCPAVDRYFHGAELLAFAAGLDFLVSVLPSTGATRHLVDDALLRALPPHALLVNVGRGDAVDEAALVDALTQGRLAGAVLDVTSLEPLPPGHPLWQAPRVRLTFHTSAPSVPEDVVPLFADNYRRFLRGEPLLHRVDFARGY